MARQLSLFKSKHQRGTSAPAPTEFKTHCIVADTLKLGARHDWRWTHIPTGEKRDLVTASRLKRMGTMRGLPDFVFFSPSRLTHFLELKRRGRISATTVEQKAWADWCIENGYPHAIADNADDALTVIRHWGALRVQVEAA